MLGFLPDFQTFLFYYETVCLYYCRLELLLKVLAILLWNMRSKNEFGVILDYLNLLKTYISFLGTVGKFQDIT